MERDNDGSVPTAPGVVGGRGAAVSDEPSAASIQPGPPTAPAAAEPSSSVDELFSILSHELRAPLTTIKGSSRTLLRHGAALEPETARQLLRDIDQEADRLHRLVDNLLELARAGVGPSALKTEPTPVDVLLRRVVADATPRAGTRRLRVRVPGDLPQPAIDPVRIEQVVRNLIDNAVKFSPATGTIDISATRQGGTIVVTVKDEGPGVAPEYHDRVFERFFRVEREGSNVAGAGLGLAICKRFVELHGGQFELESRPGQGAAFRFTLPLGEPITTPGEQTRVSESAP